MSKVRRQLGILQLRRSNGTSCYWQGTDVWGKVGIQQPFFFWQKSTRETQETLCDCHPMKERPLNIQAGWRANTFWLYTPETSDCWSRQRCWAKGETQRILYGSTRTLHIPWPGGGGKAGLSCRKYGKREKIHEAQSLNPSAETHNHMLVAHTVHAPVYCIHRQTHKFRYSVLAANSVNTPLIPYHSNLPLINAPQR